MLTTKSVFLATIAAVTTLSLTACVVPGYGPGYGSTYSGQYAQQPAYAQPVYAQPATVQQPVYAPPPPPAPAYDTQNGGQYGNGGNQYGNQYGTITNVRPVSSASPVSGVAGTVVGAVLGGVIGNQFGRGHGRDAATVIGALGGAVAGNQIGQQMGAQPTSYQIDVQVSDGSMRSFNVPTPGDLRPGDHVQMNGSQLSRY
ncbi:outer membrane lipoprotein [Paraburkholderia tropica]|uniref:glycine zipper 2TM domain-containing protein n=1 Tax=Paraburkholderia tropica TaxID=92647 RepID=UPI0038B6E008